jgi:nucleoside-diphosphate-sugar epimerase
MRLILTGATGFIGREVAAQLAAAGHEVIGIARSAPPGGHPGLKPLDLLREDPLPLVTAHRPEALVHLAWEATPGRFWSAAENLDWLAASLRLVRAFAAAGGRRLVVAGTCAEYDWGFMRLDEVRTPLRPHTLYGTAKLSLHTTLLASARTLGLSLAWGRVFFPYGPFERPGRLLSDLIDGLAAGQQVACSDGLQLRDYLHVEDVARAFVALLGSEFEGPVNLASGTMVRVRDVIERVARVIGRTDLVAFGARPRQAGEPQAMVAATDRLAAIGFHPRWSLEEGLADTVARRLEQGAVAGAMPLG